MGTCPRKWLRWKPCLPYTYKDKVTVESEYYKKEVLAELGHLKEKGDMETTIRLEAIFGRGGRIG